jgi:hypothetical protein
VHIAALQAMAVPAAHRPGIEALIARRRELQARGNATLAAALEAADGLQARLHSLADGAEELLEGA